MTTNEAGLLAHLQTGHTTLCQAWAVLRRDGKVLGFTDHDRDLEFEGIQFRAGTGLSARALQQTTGLSVDNSEAVGALSDAAISEEDLKAGRFDGAEVRVWTVNWADVVQRKTVFRGHLGEIVRAAGEFRAELRGLSDALNQPRGRVIQRTCSADLGDHRCRVDMEAAGRTAIAEVLAAPSGPALVVSGLESYPTGWFDNGRLRVLGGVAAGLVGAVRSVTSRPTGDVQVELWQRLGAAPAIGDRLLLEAGCDKRAETCRLKFANFMNFRGFPHVPGEDWLASYPTSDRAAGGRRG
jgi:uncharacterized phage protein (TIGR02218 family)